jgi:hypothetical protein
LHFNEERREEREEGEDVPAMATKVVAGSGL